MALPPVPAGYDSWNAYIEEQGATIAASQGLTLQEGKASAKLLYVAMPVRQATGTDSYREYNVFVDWASRTVSPTEGRPWLVTAPPPPPPPAMSIFPLLSVAGQSAWTAATAGNFFEVSAADYAAVSAGVPATSNIGSTDAELLETGYSGFVANLAVTYPQASSTVPASNYILGYIAKNKNAIANSIKLYSSATYRGSYTQVGTSPSVVGAGLKYYLRKAPSIQSVETYVAVLGTATLGDTTTTFVDCAYSTTPFSTWTNWSGSMAMLQTMITTTATI